MGACHPNAHVEYRESGVTTDSGRMVPDSGDKRNELSGVWSQRPSRGLKDRAKALLVAKVHEISERTQAVDRVRDKDALGVLRLLQAIETADLAARLDYLRGEALSAPVTSEAIEQLMSLFGTPGAAGTAMVVRAAGPQADPAVVAASTSALVEDLLAEL